MESFSDKLLSPRLLTETDSSYGSVRELNSAIEQDSCKNIAVTGIYGAGKSSVINTFAAEYKKNHPNKRLLRISLSTFINESGKTGEAYFNDIEYKLVQQILYRSDPDELYQSSFRRIHYRPYKDIKCLSIRIIISIIALIILFEPAFLRIDSLYDWYIKIIGSSTKIWIDRMLDIVSLGWLVYVLYLIITWAIKRISAFSSFKLKAKDYEVEISKDSSVFSKMLEELYYIFRAGQFDVVIIEDLDRLKNSSGLFLKIRELNIMLNESHAFRSDGKTVKFIYAVRDDLFDSDIRVKFFDYIIPVVPIVDSYNAADYIIEKRADLYQGKEAFMQNIPEIVLYIKEMRVLKNVLNEYEIYQKTILSGQSHLSESKLLAMIVYKNLWPDNYSMLHSRSSILNLLFDDPQTLVNKLFADKVSKQVELINKIGKVEAELKSIRKGFVDYLEAEHHVDKLLNNDIPYSLSDLIDNDYAFVWLQQDKFDKYRYIDAHNREAGTTNRDFSFEDIETAIDYNGEKVLRLSKLREQLQQYEIEKNSLDKELAHKKASSYKEILMNVDGDIALKCIKEYVGKDWPEELFNFILSMLRKGYIAEDYHTYISFCYEGTISTKDRSFINAVLQGRSLSFDYQLDNPKEVRKQLAKEDNYNGNSILNYSFIDYLMTNDDAFIDNVTEVARNNWEFIKGCDMMGDRMSSFLKKHVFSGWYDCLESIFSGDKKDLSEKIQVFFHYCPDTYYLGDKIKASLSSLYDVIASGITSDSASAVASWMTSKGIVFNSIRTPLTDYERPLYETVLKEGLFKITKENMLVIFGKPYEEAAYSNICNCGNDSLVNYLKTNINTTVNTFPETSINEEEPCLKELLDDIRIDEAWKKNYLEKQTSVMKDFEGIRNDFWSWILETGKVKATWNNVYVAINNGKTKNLKEFIAQHISEFSAQKCELEVNQQLYVEGALFTGNEFLDLHNYQALAPLFSAAVAPENFVGLDDERMSILVQNGLVGFSETGLDVLSTYPTSVMVQYVANHFEEYKDFADEHRDFCNNEFGTLLLESALSDEQKSYFLDNIALSVIDEDDYYHSYSKSICIFLNRVGVTLSTNLDLVVNALIGYTDRESWFDKISLINKINAVWEYDKERETSMINALGGGYLQLNTYYGVIALDNNPQNEELLHFLAANGHYVNRFYPQGDGRLKVTFKCDPNR